MRGAKRRQVVTPIKDQDRNTIIQQHVVKNLNAENAVVFEHDVIQKQRPTPFCMRDLNIPRWLLLLLVSLTIIVFTAFAIFASVVTLNKQGNGGPCKSNSDCREDLGLICNNYRCGCAYSHFWSTSYSICERQRMINRTCVNNTECDQLGNLQCSNVTLTGGGFALQCQCLAGMTWNGEACSAQGLYNSICVQNSNCDTTRYLFCISGLCGCNSSMFWNSAVYTSGTCEYKRTINQYCSPYDNNWCDDTGPVGQGLICAAYTNPYGSEYGVCQCSTHDYYNGTASSGNGFCVAQLLYGHACASTSQCDYRGNLTCTNNLCSCGSGQNYDSSVSSGGISGACVPAAGYMDNCTENFTCSSSQNLYCDLTYYGGNSSSIGVCLCNTSWAYWDGSTCSSLLSIGGQCTSTSHCITSEGLFCSNYTQSSGTCDCDMYHFWNYTCITKQWYNTSCTSSYVCDDNRGLQCQGLGGSMFEKCDCYNTSFIWDSLYVTNRSHTCILKLSYGESPCFGNLECQDFNYLQCNSGTCGCNYVDYYDGSRCQPKRNYTDPCANTTQCRDFSPVNLICRYGTTVPPALQCLCNISAYWEVCTQQCTTSKSIYQPCTLTTNCTSNECDITANLQCLNDSSSNATGWCNCTSLQWWNGTYCRNKGTPAWGTNTSAICNATYQCADYNLVSCPLGGDYPAINSTCECATTKYWNGITCLDRVGFGQACTLWPQYPVNTSTCLSAAGAGLICSSSTCSGGSNCTGGTCYCPTGTSWNASFLICAATSSGK